MQVEFPTNLFGIKATIATDIVTVIMWQLQLLPMCLCINKSQSKKLTRFGGFFIGFSKLVKRINTLDKDPKKWL
jgi:hypothetical protein